MRYSSDGRRRLRHAPRLLPGAGAGGSRPHAEALDPTTQTWLDLASKVTCYLSAEFLMGPQLGNNLLNLGRGAGAEASRSWGRTST